MQFLSVLSVYWIKGWDGHWPSSLYWLLHKSAYHYYPILVSNLMSFMLCRWCFQALASVIFPLFYSSQFGKSVRTWNLNLEVLFIVLLIDEETLFSGLLYLVYSFYMQFFCQDDLSVCMWVSSLTFVLLFVSLLENYQGIITVNFVYYVVVSRICEHKCKI